MLQMIRIFTEILMIFFLPNCVHQSWSLESQVDRKTHYKRTFGITVRFVTDDNEGLINDRKLKKNRN